MRNRTKALVLPAAGIAIAMALTACSGAGGDSDEITGVGFEECEEDPLGCNSGEVQEGGEITWALDDGWEGWNENRAGDRNVYMIIAQDPIMPRTGTFLPDGEWEWNLDLLEEEPELISEDPHAWEYKLNPDAQWNDGTPIGLDDFVWHWYHNSGDEDLCVDCQPNSTGYGEAVDTIEETDDGAIQVTLKDGSYEPEWMFSAGLTYPAHVAEEEGFDWENDPEAMGESSVWFSETTPEYSAGPYIIDSYDQGENVILERNENYYGEDPVLDRVTFRIIPQANDILTALENGEIDGAAPANIDAEVAERAVELDGVLSGISEGPSWGHIDFNTTNEFTSDVELRRAIFTAIDVEEIIERTFGQIKPDIEPKTNHLFRDTDDQHEDYISESGQGSGDVEAAQQILEEAGYEGFEEGETLTLDGEEVTIDFRASADDSMRVITSEVVQAQLTEIGLDIDLDPIPAGELGDVLEDADYDMVIFGWSGTPAFTTAPQQFWHSTAGGNYGDLEVDELDATIEQVRETIDIDEAADYANDAVELVVDEAYVLPLNDTPVIIMVNDEYTNIRDNWATSLRATYNLTEWGLRAE